MVYGEGAEEIWVDVYRWCGITGYDAATRLPRS